MRHEKEDLVLVIEEEKEEEEEKKRAKVNGEEEWMGGCMIKGTASSW